MAAAKRLPVLISQAGSRSSSTANLCSRCRLKLLRSNQSNAIQVRHASNDQLPFTEKLRRKIWGTDNPPGLKDPYGGPSFLERRRLKQDGQQAQREAEQAATEELEREEAEREAQNLQEPETETRHRHHGIAGSLEQKSTRQKHFKADHAATTLEKRSSLNQTRNNVIAREAALTEDADSTDAAEYKPAKTWDGLMHVGHRGHWQDIEPTEADVYSPWHLGADGGQGEHIQPTTKEETLDLLLQASQEAGREDTRDDVLVQRLDFKDPITFQILKNFGRLKGSPIPDSTLNSLARNPNSTYAQVVEIHLDAVHKPPPKNLYDSLTSDEALVRQSNVMVLPRRETPVDKEKELGRWKVIEKELKDRGLPVLGRVEV